MKNIVGGEQKSNKEFLGMPQSEVAEFLDAFPARKEIAERLASLSITLNDLIIETHEDIDTAVSILNALRVGDLKGAKRIFQIDGDKLHTYPKIEQWIREQLLPLSDNA